MPVQTITSAADLNDLTLTPGGTVVVKFFATWCGPCKAFAPLFQRAASKPENTDLVFAEADIEAVPDLAETFGVQTVPTLRAITTTAEGQHQVQALEWPITPANFGEFVQTAKA